MKLIILITILILGLVQNIYSCKCEEPRTIKESYDNTDFIFHGKVIEKELITFSETIKEEHKIEVKNQLIIDDQKLRLYETDCIIKITFEVIDKFKGEEIPETITIYTAMNSASCGFKFEEDDTYLIYSSIKSYLNFMFLNEKVNGNFGKENSFWTNQCSRTKKYNKLEAEELKTLKGKSG